MDRVLKKTVDDGYFTIDATYGEAYAFVYLNGLVTGPLLAQYRVALTDLMDEINDSGDVFPPIIVDLQQADLRALDAPTPVDAYTQRADEVFIIIDPDMMYSDETTYRALFDYLVGEGQGITVVRSLEDVSEILGFAS